MRTKFYLPQSVERRVREQVARRKEPFYLYDTSNIRAMCGEFARLPYPSTSVHFACMANSHPVFLNIIREEGLNLFVNSVMHLRMARATGFAGKQIVFAASAMDEEAMEEVHDAKAAVNLDSESQVALWQRLFPGAEFGIRCNIGELVEARNTRGGYFIGKESRLGFLPDEIRALAGNSHVAGLHLYVGTDICTIDYFRQCYEALASFSTLFPGLRYLDFGGGFGLEDGNETEFDLERYGKMSAGLMQRVSASLGRMVRMVIEPGRIIGGKAGWFVCRVTDVKQRSDRQLIGVNASSVQFPRPLFYPDSARHPVTVLHVRSLPNGKPEVLSSVCGCSTYSRDYLARDVALPQAAIGDIVVLGNAGSYCSAAYTHFLGFSQPREIFDDCEAGSRQERTAEVLFDSASRV